MIQSRECSVLVWCQNIQIVRVLNVPTVHNKVLIAFPERLFYNPCAFPERLFYNPWHRSAWIPLNTLLNDYEALFVITLYLRPPLSNATAHMSFYGIYSSIHLHLFALAFKHFVTLQASHQTSTGFNKHKVTSVFAQPPFSSVASICWLQSASCTTNAQEEGNHQHVLWQM